MPRTRQRAHPPALTLKVSGPDIRPGRIPVPDLLAICQHAQSAVTRQAESLEGLQTLRPGPKSGKVVHECTLELVSLGAGSATLSFDPAKSIAISFVTVGELYFGAEKRGWSEAKRADLETSLRSVISVPFDLDVCRAYAKPSALSRRRKAAPERSRQTTAGLPRAPSGTISR